MATLVKVIDTAGLSQETISKIEDTMEYLGEEVVDETTFCVIANSKQEILKLFDFRLKFL
jgi:flagellar biosynthesis GTPase FlhF